MTRKVNCPTCLKQISWSDENRFRPFCSERCKLIDLGDWASGRHSIAGEPVVEEENAESKSDPRDTLPF